MGSWMFEGSGSRNLCTTKKLTFQVIKNGLVCFRNRFGVQA